MGEIRDALLKIDAFQADNRNQASNRSETRLHSAGSPERLAQCIVGSQLRTVLTLISAMESETETRLEQY